MLQRTLPAGFIAPCLPTKIDKLPSGSNWLHEIKHDGFDWHNVELGDGGGRAGPRARPRPRSARPRLGCRRETARVTSLWLLAAGPAVCVPFLSANVRVPRQRHRGQDRRVLRRVRFGGPASRDVSEPVRLPIGCKGRLGQ